jgi:pyruvate formate lyase activating enzyme
MPEGLVLNIQRYSVHDGPGIRTTVFLKGCPASCWWCHNPEGQSSGPEIVVIEGRCIRCGECLEVCPEDHHHPGPGNISSSCTVCGSCVEACPTGARSMAGTTMTVDEVVDVVLKDRVFYDESGGGATFSGGEPLLQFPFLKGMLESCTDHGIHTAVDTCGYVPKEDLLTIAPLTDLFLYDLKIMDEKVHLETTGIPNASILENLRSLGEVHDNIWIRVPIIPGINDGRDNIDGIAAFSASVGGVRQVNILPYHKLGIQKFDRLGKTYQLAEISPPSPERLETLASSFRMRGLETKTGG